MSLEQPIAKRTRMRGEERRESTLRSARHVFARCGYAEASIGELARESEVTEPMLYKHFSSKKGLFMAVLAEPFRATLQERITRRAEKDALNTLEHLIGDYQAAIKADPETQRILFQAVAEAGDPEIAHCISGDNRTLYGRICQLAERAHQDGSPNPTISVDAATWGSMSIILATQYGLMLNLSGDVARVLDEMSRVWLRGLHAHRN